MKHMNTEDGLVKLKRMRQGLVAKLASVTNALESDIDLEDTDDLRVEKTRLTNDLVVLDNQISALQQTKKDK